MFIWLAILNRCWTADRLARRGMEHPERCLLCDQEEEDMQHLLTKCVFSREVWFCIFNKVGMCSLTPSAQEGSFSDWWCRANQATSSSQRKGLNSMIMLVAWEIWKHRTRCVFDGLPPRPQQVVRAIMEEAMAWKMAGANSLASLLGCAPAVGSDCASTARCNAPFSFLIVLCNDASTLLNIMTLSSPARSRKKVVA